MDGRDGLGKAKKYKPDLILADHMMPHMSGRDLLREVRKNLEISVAGDARLDGCSCGIPEQFRRGLYPGILFRIEI